MNGKDIFLGLKYVGEDLIEQAEYGTFSESKHRKPVRPLLIAALVALLLMLVGCAVAYVLNMQSMKIGNITESQPILSDNYMDITGYRDVELQVLTLAGLKGSPNYMAAQEWYRFKRSYDPDMEKYFKLYHAGTLEKYPSEYAPLFVQIGIQFLDVFNHFRELHSGIGIQHHINGHTSLNHQQEHCGAVLAPGKADCVEVSRQPGSDLIFSFLGLTARSR